MAIFQQAALKFILFFAITIFLFASVLAIETNNVIALPGGENAGKPSACAEKEEAVSCPVSCFRADPVCGVDGVTYWCGCEEARCAGVEVAKVGFCHVGNGGSGLLSRQALLLVHIVWLILLGFGLLIGLP